MQVVYTIVKSVMSITDTTITNVKTLENGASVKKKQVLYKLKILTARLSPTHGFSSQEDPLQNTDSSVATFEKVAS
jgi:hypothetical protein